jgi:hypothetical protein
MADLRINPQMPQLPIAQPQPNSVDSLTSGLGTGIGLGFQAQQLAMQKQEMEMKRQQQETANAEKALSYLTDNKFSKFLSKETKTTLFRDNVVPFLNKNYNLNIDPASIDNDGEEDGDFEKILNLVKQKADPSIIQSEWLRFVKNSEPEDAPLIRQMGDNLFPKKSSFMRPVSRVTDKGEPLYFVAGEGYMKTGADGEPEPYTGKQYAPSQNPTGQTEGQLREVLQQRGLVDGAMKKLTDDKIGLIDKRYKTIGSYVDDSTDSDAIYFRSLIELANTVIRNNYYGATLTNNEQAAFKDIAANRNLSPKSFRAQVKAMQYAFDKVEDSIYTASEAANRPFQNKPRSTGGGGNKDISGMTDEELLNIANGGQ